MTKHNSRYTTQVENLAEAFAEARIAPQDGNGHGCTKRFAVEWPNYTVTVVRKHTFERGSYFLLTVSPFSEADPQRNKRLMSVINETLKLDDTDISVDLEPRGIDYSAVIPKRVVPTDLDTE